MKPKELIQMLNLNGFIFVRQSGSHAIYKDKDRKMVVIIFG
jgi:predicted RNA binding protein YcfA (HicA-like mRNA interferase family)